MAIVSILVYGMIEMSTDEITMTEIALFMDPNDYAELNEEEQRKVARRAEKIADYSKRTAFMNAISDAIFSGEKKNRHRVKDMHGNEITNLSWYDRGFSFGLHLKGELKGE